MNLDDLAVDLAQRNATHGDFSEVARLVCDARAVFSDAFLALNPEQFLAFDMILLKLARIAVGKSDCADHWRDIAGYAVLGARSIKENKESPAVEG